MIHKHIVKIRSPLNKGNKVEYCIYVKKKGKKENKTRRDTINIEM